MNAISLTTLALAAALTGGASAAPVIYPAKDQSAGQQDQDRYACHDWARGQSGHDPAQAGATTVAAASAPTGTSPNSTMLRGAAGGAAVAELSRHDAGRGAAIGVLGAGVLDRARQQQATQARSQQLALQQQQAARNQASTTYERAFAACLEARGYVVK
jgi:hypothetical protein